MELALVGRAVPEEGHGYASGVLELGREGGARGEGNACTHDAVGPEHPAVKVGDVHRPALALADARRAPEELGHHCLRLDALGEAVAMAAMGGGEGVARREVGGDGDGHRFLARVQVEEAGQLSGCDELGELLLEDADATHATVGLEQLLARKLHGALRPAG